jgi:hypothetical protein
MSAGGHKLLVGVCPREGIYVNQDLTLSPGSTIWLCAVLCYPSAVYQSICVVKTTNRKQGCTINEAHARHARYRRAPACRVSVRGTLDHRSRQTGSRRYPAPHPGGRGAQPSAKQLTFRPSGCAAPASCCRGLPDACGACRLPPHHAWLPVFAVRDALRGVLSTSFGQSTV